MGFAFDSTALPADLPVAPDDALARQQFLETARHQVRDAFFGRYRRVADHANTGRNQHFVFNR